MVTPGSYAGQLAVRVRAQGGRYLKSLTWLVGDSLRLGRREWLRIVIATVLSLASNAAVAGVIYVYVKLLQQDRRFDLPFGTLVARESLFLLFAFIAVLAMAMLAFAVSEYVAKTAALGLHRRYQEYSLARALRLLQCLPDARCPEVSVLIDTVGPRKLATTYPFSCGWSLRFIGNAFPNVVLFVAGYGALLWLDAKTTALVTLLGIGVVAAQYPVHLLAARSSNIVEELGPYVNERLGGLMRSVSSFGNPSAPDALEARLQGYFDDDRIQRHAGADIDRFRAMELSALSTQTGGSLVLAAMLLTIGAGLLSNDADWAVLLVYATLLRRLLSSVTTIFRTVSVFSRFSPHVQMCRSFVVGASPAMEPPVAPAPIPAELCLNAVAADGGSTPLRLRQGDRLALFSGGGVTRELALTLQRALYEGQPPAGAAAGLPAIHAIPVQASSDVETIKAALYQAAASGAGLLLLDMGAYAKLGEEARSAWQARCSDRFLCLVYPASQPMRFGEQAALIRNRADRLHWLPVTAEPDSKELLQRIRRIQESGSKTGAKTAVMEDDIG